MHDTCMTPLLRIAFSTVDLRYVALLGLFGSVITFGCGARSQVGAVVGDHRWRVLAAGHGHHPFTSIATVRDDSFGWHTLSQQPARTFRCGVGNGCEGVPAFCARHGPVVARRDRLRNGAVELEHSFSSFDLGLCRTSE